MAKAVRTVHDPSLVSYMRNQLHTILTNDQICYQEDPSQLNEYK